ncbi:unnamed protein product [Trifolium pratense]|uniref:Uncharacterized protein n=1 Tax=Trifolium pratense TaxID=57577 RepID=A0ACB0K584_TRIPR|nr:unnamed protein product [Trifolium pratense]
MSESSQTTKSGRSTRSKAKIESSKIIKDAVPVTTVLASKPKAQSNIAEKKGKGKTVEKKETTKVSDDISLSTVKSSKGGSKKKKRDYKSRIPLNMSDLVFESNVNTSEKATEVESQNPKSVSEVVETLISIAGNPSQEILGSDAEKRYLSDMPVKTEMEDTPTEVDPDIANKSPSIAEMMAEKSTPVVTEEVVMQDVGTSLNENEEVETAEEEPVKEVAAEKDVETTDTTSESSEEGTGTADEGTSDDEKDTQSEESNRSIPTEEQEVEADKPAEAEEEKEKDVVDVDDYVTTKTAVKSIGGITKRLRSCTGKTVATASKTPAPRVKTKGVGPVKETTYNLFLFIFPPHFTNPPPPNRKSSAESHIWNHKPLRQIPNRRTSNPFVVLLRSIHQYLCRSSSIPPPFSFNPPPFSVVLRGSKVSSNSISLLFIFSLLFCCYVSSQFFSL